MVIYKKEFKMSWTKNKKNFPALMLLTEGIFHIVNDGKTAENRLRQGFRLATKEERDRLFVNES